MATGHALKILPLSGYYAGMKQPFSPTGTEARYSILQPRRAGSIPQPELQIGPILCSAVAEFAYSEIAIAYLPKAIVTRTGAVVVDDQFVIQETLEGTLEDNGLGAQLSADDLARCPYVDEVVINTNRLGMWNYSLFLMEVTPSLMISMMVPGLDEIRAKIFFQDFTSRQDIENRGTVFRMFGFPANRIVMAEKPLERHKGVIVFKLNDPHRSQRLSQMLSPTCAILRHEFATPSVASPRRIYISRQSAPSRKVSNFADLQDVFSKHDVTPIELERLPMASQVDLFSKADLVIAEHGAGLANIAFMRPGSVVVEAIPDTIATRAAFRYTAAHSKLNYLYTTIATDPNWKWNQDNVRVPPELYDFLLSSAARFESGSPAKPG
jgi:hypothetical protein